MAESKVRDDNYFMVSGWMVNRLELKGTALHLFAIIHGFSQDGEGSFTGSLQYLCDFTNATKKTVISALKELTEKGYVIKTENFINGVKFNTYRVSTPVVEKLHWGSGETTPGVVENLHRGGEEITPNNKDNNKSLISKEIVKEVIDLYHSICVSYPKIRAVSAAREKAIKARLETYSIDDFRSLFEKAEASSFLKGKNDRGWAASFDWLINESNMAKVLEDNYVDKPKYGRKEPVPGWAKREPDHYTNDPDFQLAIQRMLAEAAEEQNTIENDPELAERAARLKEQLQGG